MAAPTAFISYSWESDEHKTWVRQFATQLRSDGIDVFLDQWELVPGDQLPAFMEKAVRDNQFVLVICTPKYKVRSDNRQGGAGYEGDIMTGEVLSRANHRKFIPILREGNWQDAAPSWMTSKLHLDLKGDPYNQQQYTELLRTLYDQREPTPPLGPAPLWSGDAPVLNHAGKRNLRLHVLKNEVEALDYAPDKAVIRFTISNLTGDLVKLTSLKLRVLERIATRKVRLPKVGAPLTEFGLSADLSEGDEIDLLVNTTVQFLLKPNESDAFAIDTIGEQGYLYSLMLYGQGESVSDVWSETFESSVLTAEYPIRSKRGLRAITKRTR